MIGHKIGQVVSAGALLSLVLASAASAHAACETKASHKAAVAEVTDGQTLRLDDGSEVRLTGVLSPQAPNWWKDDKPWPPAGAARKALRALVGSDNVELRFAEGEEQRDRHDRFLAQVFVLRGNERIWVQNHMISTGFARVVSFAGHRACVRQLLEQEQRARNEGVGLWRTGWFVALQAGSTDALLKRRGSFQLVEGIVRSVGKASKWTFLNFADDWRNDFTVAVAAKNRRKFQGSDIGLEGLKGKTIRVRGWIERWNGPAIKATHPEQIEVLNQEIDTHPSNTQ